MTRLTRAWVAVAAFMCWAPVATVRANAPPGRYTTGQGTVVDTKTKLVWQQPCASSRMTWANAKSYCAGLGATLAGSGWRLPTINELATLVDTSIAPPRAAIDPVFFPNAPKDDFWSSTLVAGTPSTIWVETFSIGGAGQTMASMSYLVRCVR